MEPGLVIALVVLVLLAGAVPWLAFPRRAGRQRALFAELGAALELKHVLPENPHDRYGAGRLEGRHRGRRVALVTETHAGGQTRRGRGAPPLKVRVRWARSLGLGAHGGTGPFRARKPPAVPLQGPLGRRLRLFADDAAGARELFDAQPVAEALRVLDGRCRGVRVDDGVLEVEWAFPASAEGLRAVLDEVVSAAERVDAARAAG